MDALSSSDVCLFGSFRFDRRGGVLLRCNDDGQYLPVSIGSRAVAVLSALIARPGDLVSRDEIMRAAWPGTVVEEGNLTVQISALRRILDAGTQGESCIQTVSGRGYRFVPRVTREEDVSPAAGPVVVPVTRIVSPTDKPAVAGDAPGICDGIGAPPTSARRRAALAMSVILVLMACLSAGGLWKSRNWIGQRPVAYSPEDRRESIMVLPFENSSGDPTQDDAAASVTLDVMTDIVVQTPADPLVPASAAAVYRGKTLDLRAIARDQDVHFVLTGNVRRQDGRVILSATLYQTEDQRAVWSRRYDQPNHPDGWRLIIQSVVASVGNAMTDAEAARAMREHPESLDKRDLVMVSFAGSWAQVSKEKFLDRIAFAERALALDPNYVVALEQAARVRAYLVLTGNSSDPDSDLARAAQQADRALMLAPDNFWVLVAKATVLSAQGKLGETEALMRRLIRLRPAWGPRYKDLGRVLLARGKLKEALETFVTAKQFALGNEPTQQDDSNIAVALLANDQFAEAITQARLAIAESSTESGAVAEVPHLALIAAESQNGQDEEARAELRSFLAGGRTLRDISTIGKVPFLAANAKLIEGLRRAGMPEM